MAKPLSTIIIIIIIIITIILLTPCRTYIMHSMRLSCSVTSSTRRFCLALPPSSTPLLA
ncbi:hypothetical protein M752DRAFT_43846 [Aspergillus phoenicis ATCC 13157]|uniref:Uncharacterized protein n=1 Tax=Aspergillus phoenicis ATCC 13157 TaxID=1353007 RepID=A0A370PE41_ASPPH|nr:hypothetical protein M752DRAFT_43846 [Aspergillus phoenicis ATCC 13157]